MSARRMSADDGHSARVREVWHCNFEEEFQALLTAFADEASCVVALDMEFPGFLRDEPRWMESQEVRFQALRENVDQLRPIQVGLAVAGDDRVVRGSWTFNLRFDLKAERHTGSSVEFLRRAGVDFARHAEEGLDAAVFGRRLFASRLVGLHRSTPTWVTFAGAYDFGFLLKLLSGDQPLPPTRGAFRQALELLCPRRCELRDELPHGSLGSLGQQLGVARHGRAHTAGSDALMTLEIYIRLRSWESFMWRHQDAVHWGRWPAWSSNSVHSPMLGQTFFLPPLAPDGSAAWCEPWFPVPL